MKKFDEDKFIEILAIIAVFAIILLIMWLINVPKAPNYTKIEETAQIVENSVESVEKCVFVPEETQPTYTEKEMTITAYCSCVKCCGKTDGITASGVKAVEGVTVAMDKSIPFGTKIYIDGVGERIVQDRGGAIKENRIDLYFNDHQSALSFGRQTKKVRIME